MISGWYLQRVARPPVVRRRTGIAAGSNLVLGFLIKVDIHFFFPRMLTVVVGLPNQCMTRYLCVIN